MIFPSIGLPGGFADWCDSVTARLAAVLGGEVSLASWPNLGDMLGYIDLSGALDEMGRTLIRTNGAQSFSDLGRNGRLAALARRRVAEVSDPRDSEGRKHE